MSANIFSFAPVLSCKLSQSASDVGKRRLQVSWSRQSKLETISSFGRKMHQSIQSCKTSQCKKHTIVIASAASTDSDKVLTDSLSAIQTDDNVPEGHQGLHSFLYGEGGAEAHNAPDSVYKVRQGEDDGTSIVPVSIYLAARDAEKPLGVYAVYSQEKKLQYVGYSRNVVLSLKGHLSNLGSELCKHVRVMVFANRAMATRQNMETEVQAWLKEAGELPPGNSDQAGMWDSSLVGTNTSMSPAELAEYEAKKLKMRKAMGENLYDAVEGESKDTAQRRLDFLRAVEGDDWSAVIDGQTQGTIEDPMVTGDDPSPSASSTPDTASNPGYQMSPFARLDSQKAEEEEVVERLPLTLENADNALEEVRPYMIADGGNVEVVGVEDGVVALRLQGACGTCPSSTATMQMGIEKALEKAFGDELKGVVQVDKLDTSASVLAVNAHLDVLRPAIQNYGGSVEVLKVSDGVCDVKYNGPAPIAMGITAAIKDKFPDVKEVTMHE